MTALIARDAEADQVVVVHAENDAIACQERTSASFTYSVNQIALGRAVTQRSTGGE